MKKYSSRTAVILSTPFQALCAIEALHYFKIMHYDVYLLDIGHKAGVGGTKEILDYYHIPFQKLSYDSFKKFISRLNERKEKYSRFVLGDYFSLDMYILAGWMSQKDPEFIYVDDGGSSLLIDSRKLPLKSKLRKAFADILMIGKGKKNKKMFSVFSIQTSKFSIVRNKMELLKSTSASAQAGVYIIGTISGHPGLGWYNLPWFEEVKKYIAGRFPDEPIYYCPHRRDENPLLDSWIGQASFQRHKTEGNVEFDFIRKKLNPKAIIGFGSTALYTLKSIYPDARIYSLFPSSFLKENTSISKGLKVISEEYGKEGIEVDILNL